MNAKVLVTGALGFVGLNIVRELALEGINVLALTRREADEAALKFLAKAGEPVRWVRGDVTERSSLEQIISQEQVTHILHAAAVTASPAEERENPLRMFDVNATGTLNVLEAARKNRVERVVYVSSSGLYGAARPLPLKRETDALQITGLYTICKQTSEELCRRYAELHDMRIAVGRLGSAYGPMERPTQSRQGMSAIYQIVHYARGGVAPKVFGAEIARDFCYIEDVAAAFVALLLRDNLNHHIYNVADAKAYSLREGLEALVQVFPAFYWQEVVTKEAADIVQLPTSARAGLDTSRLQKDTAWHAQYPLAAGIRAYLDWLKVSD